MGWNPIWVNANFIADTTLIHEGDTVSFINLSSGSPSNMIQYLWTFEGVTPSLSNDTNPEVVYMNEGTYDVQLTAHIYGSYVDTELKEDFITVLPATKVNKINMYEIIELKALKGKPLVMVMIYTTCKAACPRLIADMRNIEKQIPENKKEDLQYVLISIDPETDTPARLKEFAIENQMDGEQWTFLQGSISGVREFANVLAVKYKQISPMDLC